MTKDVNTMKKSKTIIFDEGSIIIDLILAAFVLLTSVPIAAYIDGYTPSYEVPYIIMMTGLIPVSLASVIRHINMSNSLKVVTQIITFAIHSACVISYYLISVHWMVLVSLVAINFVYALISTLKPPEGKIKLTGMLFAVLANLSFYLAFSYDGRSNITTGLMINVYLALLLYVIARQINEFEVSYYHSIKSSMAPVKDVTKQNRKTVFWIILGFGIAVMLLFMPPLSTIIRMVSYLWELFLGNFRMNGGEIKEEYDSDVTDGIISYEEPESTPVMQIILAITFVVIAIAIIVLIILLFKKKKHTKQVMIESNDEVTDVIEKIDHGKSRLLKTYNFGTGYEMKIRKKFYKKVKKSIAKGAIIKDSYTPNEIANAVNKVSPESITELKNEYEKVRYN